MKSIVNYHGKSFKSVDTSDNGEVNNETVFTYYQNGNIVWADYSGGGIVKGHLIATADADGNLDMRYHHINENNELMTGICKSKPEILKSGRIRLHEEWEWTCRDHSKGRSIIEEVGDDESF